MRFQGIRQPRSSAAGRLIARHLGQRPRSVNALHTRGRQDAKGECEAELAVVDPIDEHLDVDMSAMGLHPFD